MIIDSLPAYDPLAHCPKCDGDDVHTSYVKQGRYDDPCEFRSAVIREHEHLHRFCRRCSYQWCEACAEKVETPVQVSTGIQRVAVLRSTIDQLRKIGANWADLMYTMEKHAAAYDLLLTRYAKFHTGDRVQLGKTPIINETCAPGWVGSKHFLVAGASATVREVDVRDGVFYYQVVFDTESWLDAKKIERAVENDRRHSYCFAEDYLVTAS
jgi:hypothetical protein